MEKRLGGLGDGEDHWLTRSLISLAKPREKNRTQDQRNPREELPDQRTSEQDLRPSTEGPRERTDHQKDSFMKDFKGFHNSVNIRYDLNNIHVYFVQEHINIFSKFFMLNKFITL